MKRFGWMLALGLGAGVMAQAQGAGQQAGSQTIRFNVTAEDKAGNAVTDLEEKDFTLRDNGAVQAIHGFRKVVGTGQASSLAGGQTGGQAGSQAASPGAGPATEPVHVVVVMDAVNTPFGEVAYERSGVDAFLKANGGKLTYPTTFGFVTDKGAQVEKTYSKDGNQLSGVLAKFNQGLRDIHRDSQWAGLDQLQISLGALRQLVEFCASTPGRKLLIWVSPGWPLLTGPRIYLDNAQTRSLFAEVVEFSAALRQADVTLYDVNPIGAQESLLRADYYQEWVKGVRQPQDVQIASLGLQVLAVQSGGLTFESNSDVTGLIERCLKDGQAWYEITEDAPVAEKPVEFHEVQVKADRPGVEVRTRNGYYLQR